MATRQLQVLFLPSLLELENPWLSDIQKAVGSRHTLKIYQQDEPLAPQFVGTDVVIDFSAGAVTREMADAASSVKLWQLLGTGYDYFDLEYWQMMKIPVANCPGVFSAVPLAESAIMFMLMLAHRWHGTQESLSEGIFYQPLGSELDSKLLGLVGLGATGCELARKARAFSLRVRAIDIRHVSPEEQRELGLEFVGKPDDLDDLIPQCDFLSLHVYLNSATRHMIDARRLGLMKPTAFLINVARGALVDEQALYKAISEERLAGAGLDVFGTEPMDPAHPLLKLKNVVATPHTASVTVGTSQRRAACVAENIERIADGLPPLYLIKQ